MKLSEQQPKATVQLSFPLGVLVFGDTQGTPPAGARMSAMQSREITYHDGELQLSGYAAWEATPDGGPRAGVLVAHTAIGPQEDFIRDKVHRLARMGYVGFALDMFGAGRCVFGEEKDAANLPLKQDRAAIARRAQAAMDALTAMPEVDGSRVAALGYCLGGKVVLDLARIAPPELRAAVSFHGILDELGGAASAPVTARCLCYHGARDPFRARRQPAGLP
eukprot:jgi/Tetstr1/426302/TSEL_016618.t1